MYFLPPQYDVSVVPAGWEWRKAESKFTLAKSGAIILPRPHFVHRHDTRHDDTRHDDTQHDDTRYNDIQHNNKEATPRYRVQLCYAYHRLLLLLC